jgi:hypothetical protein
MHRRNRILLVAFVFLAFIAVTAVVLLDRKPPSNTVTLVFNATVGERPLVFNAYEYTNPGGGEAFKIRDFRFYVSNLKLRGKEGEFIEKDSYHLARFDNEERSYWITLNGVALSEVTQVSFSIGVDAAANTSLQPRGDLDPNNQMAWNWEVGYKFLLLEGGIRVAGELRPLVYHIGFSENRRELDFVAPRPIALDENGTIAFHVDAMKLFTGTTIVDMTKIPSVKFDKGDARLFADNYRNMISANW